MSTEVKRKWRRGRPAAAAQLSRPDHPYTMKLPDGRIVYVEIPGRWVTEDRDGQAAFLPEAVALLDKIRALALPVNQHRVGPSPGYITSLRKGLGLTQQELGERLGVDKLTVSRWERGTVRPGRKSLSALEDIRREAVRAGAVVAS